MDYGEYNEMKWFRNLWKLRDAGIDNKTAVNAIVREDYFSETLKFPKASPLHAHDMPMMPWKRFQKRHNY